jgi:hypothetical protein
MPRGVWTYIIVSLVASWGLGILAFLAQQSFPKDAKQFAGFIFLPLIAVPMLTVWILHRQQASSGNPYAGLVWGPTSWYWLLYFGLLAYAAVVVGAVIVVGGASFDPKMGGYIENAKAMMEAQGKSLPSGAEGTLVISGWATLGFAALFGPWFGAAISCLTGFPLLGWLNRRLLVKGRAYAFAVLAVFSMLVTASVGLLDNPQLGELGLPVRMALFALSSLAALPLNLWVFYRTRSVVLAMLAVQTYLSGQAALSPFLADTATWLTSAQIGVAVSAGLLLLGVALWVWKDPGGQELAVAAVAQDGTPLTPEMLEQARNYAASQAAGQVPG